MKWSTTCDCSVNDLGPRPDLSSVDPIERDLLVLEVKAIIEKHEQALARDLKALVTFYLAPNPELWISVNDQLAETKVISKARLKEFLSLREADGQ